MHQNYRLDLDFSMGSIMQNTNIRTWLLARFSASCCSEHCHGAVWLARAGGSSGLRPLASSISVCAHARTSQCVLARSTPGQVMHLKARRSLRHFVDGLLDRRRNCANT